ncbi:hypothetical protein ACN28E_33135 [Archangium lansingense]|uniref:hypothetical protein n=1 Tax=Archangium lansingense TaxID=2995310 RepID=UPI003B7D655E
MTVTWRQALKSPDFWCWYWRVEGCEDLEESAMPQEALRIGPPGPGPALVLEVSKYERTLYLAHPRLPEQAQLGWMDDAHWHPHALRWEETIRAAEGLTEGRSEALLLLTLFTPTTPTDDREQVSRLLEAASRETGIPEPVREQILSVASIAVDAEWRCDAGRWVIEGKVYSLRDPRNPSFPFLELQELSSR